MVRSTHLLFASAAVGLAIFYSPGQTSAPDLPTARVASTSEQPRRLIGSVASVRERESGLEFRARVDTGAKSCSLHVAEWEIPDAAATMAENVGKTIRFRVENRCGKSWWLERPIAEVALIRNAEGEELRYMVPLELTVDGVRREVLVSLNDRSEMRYAMLVGRNYLEGQFIVDVADVPAADPLLVRNP